MTIENPLTWPNERTQNVLNRIIRESHKNPFGVSAYNPNEPILDFVGRKKELEIFKEQIRIVVHHGISRAVRLEGPAGVGKSTLFNYLKDEIRNERLKKNKIPQYLTDKNDILSSYFNIPDKISDFTDIWIPMFEGLRANFEAELGDDVHFPVYLAVRIVHKLLQDYPEEISQIIWKEGERPYNFQEASLRDIYDPLVDGGQDTVRMLQNFWKENKRKIRSKYSLSEGNINYRLSREDNEKISNLFRVLDEDDDFLDKITKTDPEMFKTTEDLIGYFNVLMRYYTCFTQKIPIILLGIDEAAKSPPQEKEIYYQNLANLFVKLRNSLNNILFVFISTTEDWAEYDEVIENFTDLKSQVSEFMYKMTLSQLKVEEVVEVFKRRMKRFWADYTSYNTQYLNYPFSEQAFTYFYRYNNRDLRKSILFLKDVWVRLKILDKVPKLETYFDCMKFMQQYEDRPIDPNYLRPFEWKIIRDVFNNGKEYQRNASRSSAIEKGIEAAWRTLMMDKRYDISDVQNNKTFIVRGQKRRPDIYIEIRGQFGAEYRRRIEFQVKAYKENSWIELKHIESSLELFKTGIIDFLYFIITGAGLDAEAENAVLQLEKTYPDRIRRPPLNEKQKNYLYFLALYKEITGKELYTNPKTTLKIAEHSISTILGISVYDFIKMIRELGYREPEVDVIEENEGEIGATTEILNQKEITTVPTEPSSTETPLDVFSNQLSSQPQTESQSEIKETPITIEEKSTLTGEKIEPPREIPRPEWCLTYSDLETFFPELSALCRYMKSREKGRYAWKFTEQTVINNIIERDAALEKGKFRNLIKIMKSKGYIQKVKTSWVFTESGKKLYFAVKNANYEF